MAGKLFMAIAVIAIGAIGFACVYQTQEEASGPPLPEYFVHDADTEAKLVQEDVDEVERTFRGGGRRGRRFPKRKNDNDDDDDDDDDDGGWPGRKPSCCRAIKSIPFMDANEWYDVSSLLYGCDRRRCKERGCSYDCCDAKTSQACKACCDAKAELGLGDDKCKARCDGCFSCEFEPYFGPVHQIFPVQCRAGKCGDQKKCVTASAGTYCECVHEGCPTATNVDKCDDGYIGGRGETVVLPMGSRNVQGSILDPSWRLNSNGQCSVDLVRNMWEGGMGDPARKEVLGGAYATYSCECEHGEPVCTLYVLSYSPTDESRTVQSVEDSFMEWNGSGISKISRKYIRPHNYFKNSLFSGWHSSYTGDAFQCGKVYYGAQIHSNVVKCDDETSTISSTGVRGNTFSFMAPCPVCDK